LQFSAVGGEEAPTRNFFGQKLIIFGKIWLDLGKFG